MSQRLFSGRYLVALVAVWVGTSVCAFAESVTVPLSLSVESGAYGNYLSADFDFGTAFSHVESLTLEFAMPDGYEGNAMTTGNSSYFRYLAFVLGDTGVSASDVWKSSPENGITQFAFFVYPNDPAKISFGGYPVSFDGTITEPAWPEFILQGHGALAFIDDFESSFHPLPERIELSSTTSWQPPVGISGASLTIVGALVPEPGSAYFL